MGRKSFSYKEYSEQLEVTIAGLKAKNKKLKGELKSLRSPVAIEEEPAAAPGTLYRVHCVARERGEFPEDWTQDFATLKEAERYMQEINGKNTSLTAPNYYEQAVRLEQVDL